MTIIGHDNSAKTQTIKIKLKKLIIEILNYFYRIINKFKYIKCNFSKHFLQFIKKLIKIKRNSPI